MESRAPLNQTQYLLITNDLVTCHVNITLNGDVTLTASTTQGAAVSFQDHCEDYVQDLPDYVQQQYDDQYRQ